MSPTASVIHCHTARRLLAVAADLASALLHNLVLAIAAALALGA